MSGLYQEDLAYIQAVGFGDFGRGVAPEVIRRLRSSTIPIRRVLEVGCGAGPLTAGLVAAGFEVTGMDASPELVEIARRAAPAAHFIQGSIYELEMPPCEAVLAIGEPLTYHEADDGDLKLRRFFQRSGERLPSGGMLIFDVIETGERSLAARTWKSGEDWAVLVETKEDRVSRTLSREIETFRKVGNSYRRGREVHRVRLFDADEIREWLDEAGFATETATEYGETKLPARRRAFFCTRV